MHNTILNVGDNKDTYFLFSDLESFYLFACYMHFNF